MTTDQKDKRHVFMLSTGHLQEGKSTFQCREAVVTNFNEALLVEFPINIDGESGFCSAVCFSIHNGNVQVDLTGTLGFSQAVFELHNNGSWNLIQKRELTNEGT